MKIVHISDTHGAKYHTRLIIPECDVLIHSGDIGGRTNTFELLEFLEWFDRQPAKEKIFVPGNHDITLDRDWVAKMKSAGSLEGILANQHFHDNQDLLKKYNIHYLVESEWVYEGVKFFGSPYTPSFHRRHWAFNADRGEEIQKRWAKIPTDTNILITHGPSFGVLDTVDTTGRDSSEWQKDGHVGCEDLTTVIKNRLIHLKLHCFGHIHDNTGVIYQAVSNRRRVMFSNGAVISNSLEQVVYNPLVINIPS